MPEPKRIERRVMNGGEVVVLAVVHRWDNGPDNEPVAHYFVDQVEVWPETFTRLALMFALSQGR